MVVSEYCGNTYLLVLIGGDGDELCFLEAKGHDALLLSPGVNSDDV